MISARAVRGSASQHYISNWFQE